MNKKPALQSPFGDRRAGIFFLKAEIPIGHSVSDHCFSFVVIQTVIGRSGSQLCPAEA